MGGGGSVAIARAQADAQIAMAQSQSNALIQSAMYQSNADTSIASTNAEASKYMATERYDAMIFMATKQYDEAKLQMDYADRADGRQTFLWKRELDDRLQIATIQVNAQIAANNLQHRERMTEMALDYDVKMEELKASEKQPIDLGSLYDFA